MGRKQTLHNSDRNKNDEMSALCFSCETSHSFFINIAFQSLWTRFFFDWRANKKDVYSISVIYQAKAYNYWHDGTVNFTELRTMTVRGPFERRNYSPGNAVCLCGVCCLVKWWVAFFAGFVRFSAVSHRVKSSATASSDPDVRIVEIKSKERL